MTVQKEVRAVPVLLGARLPLSDLWFWKHQLQSSLEVESELRFGRSEPRIPLTLSDWLGVVHFSTNESLEKACLEGAKTGGRQVVRLRTHPAHRSHPTGGANAFFLGLRLL